MIALIDLLQSRFLSGRWMQNDFFSLSYRRWKWAYLRMLLKSFMGSAYIYMCLKGFFSPFMNFFTLKIMPVLWDSFSPSFFSYLNWMLKSFWNFYCAKWTKNLCLLFGTFLLRSFALIIFLRIKKKRKNVNLNKCIIVSV